MVPIVTIDGPSGSGKGALSKALAIKRNGIILIVVSYTDVLLTYFLKVLRI